MNMQILLKYGAKRIEASNTKMTRLDYLRENRGYALWIIALFLFCGLCTFPMMYFLGYPMAKLPLLTGIMTLMMLFMGFMANLALVMNPLPPTVDDVHAHNQRIYEELKRMYG
jgi:hypothetical protein